jgi:predicted nucleic acid-binding protein
MVLLYLDYNCFQRGFDDPGQVRIQLEALACQEIFLRVEEGSIALVWSFMHEDETIFCPFPERQLEAWRLATLCLIRLGPNEKIASLAQLIQQKAGITSKDALHLACACHVRANFFLSCDDRLIKQAGRLTLDMAIMNPLDFVRMENFNE